jgi:PAS domain S-box-containing protein
LGRPLPDVFHIINEKSRQTVENPALRVLREGKIVGLANHTILVARDGTEWPIDDSAAPIRNEQGEVAGVVLVFRDITERKREEFAHAERTRLVALRADVSTAMASGQTTPMALEHCCEALVRYLGVTFAGIWTLKDAEQVLESQARAGRNTHLDGPPRRMQVGQFNIGRVASTRKPYLTNAVPNDPNVSAPEWANQEGMIAFAGYPLVVEERLIGVVAVFARCIITEGVLAELAPLADGIAQYIDRRFDQERFRQQAELHRITLASIGDAVLTTDACGNVTYLNTVAQDLTGWGQGDANDKPLTTVFNIVNEQTDQPIENPVVKVLREGRVAERASHTVLIAKDGTQVPIDHSAAPIKDSEGNVLGAVLIFRNVTAERTADRAQALLGSIVESSDDAIVSKSLEGIVRSWNSGAERLFGYQASEIIGESIAIIIPPDRIEEEQLILEKLRRGERLEHFETVRVSKGGRAIPISLTVSPIRNRNGEITGASKIARDITPQKLSAEERERQLVREQSLRNEAQAANRLKDEFLAMVSHELRTPLNAILGWTTMLGSGKLDQSGFAQAIEVIKRNAKSQAQLIEDLLDVSRIISGKVRLDLKPIALITVIKAAADSVQPPANAKGIQLQIIVDAADDQVEGDAIRLQQVIWNLLSNSIKFTPKGGQITVKLDRTDSMVQIMITDTGAGISAQFLPFVFDRFKQADAEINKNQGGLGLGLAIARHLTEMHGGTIEADSAGEGLGATFKIRLPLAAVGTTAVAGIASAQNGPLVN